MTESTERVHRSKNLMLSPHMRAALENDGRPSVRMTAEGKLTADDEFLAALRAAHGPNGRPDYYWDMNKVSKTPK